MEGNSFDSTSKTSSSSSSITSNLRSITQRSSSISGVGGEQIQQPAIGYLRTRSVVDQHKSSTEILDDDDALDEGSSTTTATTRQSFGSSSAAADFSNSIIGDRTSSPLRRGPGRPRKDPPTTTPRLRQTQTRLRGGSGGGGGRTTRIKQSSMAQTRGSGQFGSSASGRSSTSPIGGELGSSAFEEESSQSSDAAVSMNKDQRCSFCYLTASSRLGQGDLIRHEPTPGFNLSAFVTKKSSTSLRDQSPIGSDTSGGGASYSGHDSILTTSESTIGATATASTEQLTLRINLKHSKVVRPKPSRKKADIPKLEDEFVEEIDLIGLPDDIEYMDLFEPTGHCSAHHCCASWSDGVVQSESYALLHVDNAAAAAMMQRCAGCGRPGASISCRADGCKKKYHYPCASAYGGFQDINTLAFLCPDHLDEVEALPDTNAACAKCETIGDVSTQLFCLGCGDHYHSTCLEQAVSTSVNVRAGWQCPECKMCQHCQRFCDDSRMLMCDSCDKGYHVYCMEPPMTAIPKHGWKCKNCRICSDCSSRSAGNGPNSRWHSNYTICDSCFQQRNKGLTCPLCERSCRNSKQKSARQCTRCKRNVHLECIRKSLAASSSESALAALASSAGTTDYVCSVCEGVHAPGAIRHSSPSHSQLAAAAAFPDATSTPSSSASLDENEEETEMLGIFLKTELAGGESLSGTDSPFPDLDMGDMDVMQLLEPEENSEFAPDFVFGNFPTESKRGGGRGGGSTAAVSKKQSGAGLPRKKGSSAAAGGRTSSRAKSSSCSSSAAGSIRAGSGGGGNGTVGERRRTSRGGGGGGPGGGRGGGQRGAAGALQSTLSTLQNMISNHNNGNVRKKDDEEYIHTIVVSANDEFVFCQDICVICGSFGKGPEGHFIACMQCGQCYHPYCANIHINAAIMRRGWRCLDCTVCEGCGRGEDEQHLLLCDDCDVSFHTYCLDPPLENIPAGSWVCKWCSSCQVCGDALSPELSPSSVKVCLKCESLVACPLCRMKYSDGDLVIQCDTCERWCHCKCNGLTNEDAIDKAADKGFKCWYCRPNAGGHHGDRNAIGKAVDSSFHVVMDGVSLTKSGLRTVQWRPRRRLVQTASNSAASMSALDDVIDSVHALVTRGLDEQGGGAAGEEPTDERIDATDQDRLNVDVSGGENPSTDPSLFSPVDKKKMVRSKKYFKVGVGGFLVRQTRQRTSEKPDEAPELMEPPPTEGIAEDGRESAMGDAPAAAAVGKPKKRKRQTKKLTKIQLEDNYPAYIQEAFFGNFVSDGRFLTDESAKSVQANLDDQDSPVALSRIIGDNELEKLASPPLTKTHGDKHHHRRGGDQQHGSHTHEQQTGPISGRSIQSSLNIGLPSQQGHGSRRSSAGAAVPQDPIGEGFEDLGEGDDIFPHQMDIHHHEFSNLIDMLMNDGDMDPVGHEDGDQRQSPNLENLIDSRDYVGIGDVDSAEMDRLMGNMLEDELHGACDTEGVSRHQPTSLPPQQPSQPQLLPPQPPQQSMHAQQHGGEMIPNQSILHPAYHQQPSQYGADQVHMGMQQPQPPHHPYGSGGPYGAMASYQMQSHDVVDYNQDPSRFLTAPQPQSQPPTGPSTPVQSATNQDLSLNISGAASASSSYQGPCSPKGGDSGGANDGKGYLERWEPDESLGDRATIAAVLYANTNHPDLRLHHPVWTDRAKQIAKLWRLLAPESRQQYVQMARENRAASRQMGKAAKKTNEPISRQSSHTPQIPESPDHQHAMVERQFSYPGPPSVASQIQDFKQEQQGAQQSMDILETASRVAGPGPFGASSMPPSYGAVQHSPAIQQQQSRSDEFKVPQTPTGNYRPDLLKRSDSQPQTPKIMMDEHQIKTEPFSTQSSAYGSDQTSANQQGYGGYGPPTYNAAAAQSASMEYANQGSASSSAPDWARCQPSLLEDFIEMERRDQRSQQSFVPQSPVAMAPPSPWPEGAAGQPIPPPGSQFPPRPPALPPPPPPSQVQRQRSMGGIPEPPPETSTIPRDRQHEEWLSRTRHEIDVRQKAMEGELNQLRKNKKNIAAKQRQLKKSNLELPPEDSTALVRLNQDISERQKELDGSRKQAKQHNNLIQEYNAKHGLAPTPAPAVAVVHHGPPSATPLLSPVGASHSRSSCGSDVFENAPQQQQQQQQQQFIRPPMTPTTPIHPSAHYVDPSSMQMRVAHAGDPNAFGAPPSGGQQIVLQHPPYGHYRPNAPPYQQQQQQPMVVAPSTPAPSQQQLQAALPSALPPPQAAVEPKKKKKYYKKKVDSSKQPSGDPQPSGRASAGCKGMQQQETERFSPPCPTSNLLAMAAEFDPDVVFTVSSILDAAVAELDGPSSAAAAERENVLLKRLLDNSPPSGASAGEDGKKGKQTQGGKRTASISQGSPKKRQRRLGNVAGAGGTSGPKVKGSATNATQQSAADAQTAFLEQLAIQLKTLPVLAIQEPAPKSDPLISNAFGVTQLARRTDKPLITGNGPGRMRLTFMPDYYTEMFDKASANKSQEPAQYQRQAIGQQYVTPAIAPPHPYAMANRPYLAGLQQPQQQLQQQGLHPYQMRQPIVLGGDNRQLVMAGQQAMHPGYGQQGAPVAAGAFGYAQAEADPRSLTESPLEVIYSDAPEFEEDVLPAYPALKPVVPAEGRLSPNFRLVAPVPMRAVPADPPTFYESIVPASRGMSTTRGGNDEDNMVSVTITLDIERAQNIHEVLRDLSALLQVEPPKQFEVHIDTPPHTPDKVLPKDAAELIQQQQQPSAAAICRQCATAVQQAAVRKKLAELGLTPKDDDADEVIFCSHQCYDQFATGLKAPSTVLKSPDAKPSETIDEKPIMIEPTAATISEAGSVEIGNESASTSTNQSAIDQQQPSTTAKSTSADQDSTVDEIIKRVLGNPQLAPPSFGSKEEIVHVKDLPRFKDFGEEGQKVQIYEKRWKGSKWKSWASSIGDTVFIAVGQSPDAMYLEISKSLFRPSTLPTDVRICDFCTHTGDGPTETSGRLLNLDAGRWVHVNCALWSAEVYERVEGALVNVEKAVRRASSTVCCHCQRFGASVPCYKLRCEKNYHLPCAVEMKCLFFADKTMCCPNHSSGTSGEVATMNNLTVLRRVYVERDENRIIAKLYQQGDSGELTLRVGSLIFGNIGQLLPQQLRNFHVKDFIYPVGYAASRIYWSSKDVRKRNLYSCSISDRDGQPEFNVAYNEESFAEVTYSESSASGAWSGILQPLEQLRVDAGMLKIFSTYLGGEVLFGLTESAIIKMIESLPGVDMMPRYECKYGRSPLIDLPLAVNPSGCARCEPRFRTYIKRSHTHTASSSAGASSSSFQNLMTLSGLSNEMALYQYPGSNRQTLVSKWSQYRKMKQDWQNNVYLARSKIQGLGLYAKRDIEMNAMVIEYIGEVIRNEVAERREKLYQAHNRGIYMFRIDEERVIDATVSGGLARYINHSCDPNCVAELFEFDREAHIMIMSCRPITKGEELTYDYQFDVEDDSSKIPCLCGAPNCQKWMN